MPGKLVLMLVVPTCWYVISFLEMTMFLLFIFAGELVNEPYVSHTTCGAVYLRKEVPLKISKFLSSIEAPVSSSCSKLYLPGRTSFLLRLVSAVAKWLSVRIPLPSLKLQIWRLLWGRSSLTVRQTIECGFTLKLVRDMMITYNLNDAISLFGVYLLKDKK